MGDPSSMMLFLLGKDNWMMPFVIIGMMIFSNIDKIQTAFNKVLMCGKAEYVLSGKYQYNKSGGFYEGDLSDSLYAIIYFVDKHIKDNHIKLKNACNIELPRRAGFTRDEPYTIPANYNKIMIDENIGCYINIKTQNGAYNTRHEEMTHKQDVEEFNVEVKLITNKSVTLIVECISKLTTQYKTVKEDKIHSKMYILKPIYRMKNPDRVKQLDYIQEIDFTSNKTFDNLFFDGKDELIKRLDYVYYA